MRKANFKKILLLLSLMIVFQLNADEIGSSTNTNYADTQSESDCNSVCAQGFFKGNLAGDIFSSYKWFEREHPNCKCSTLPPRGEWKATPGY